MTENGRLVGVLQIRDELDDDELGEGWREPSLPSTSDTFRAGYDGEAEGPFDAPLLDADIALVALGDDGPAPEHPEAALVPAGHTDAVDASEVGGGRAAGPDGAEPAASGEDEPARRGRYRWFRATDAMDVGLDLLPFALDRFDPDTGHAPGDHEPAEYGLLDYELVHFEPAAHDLAAHDLVAHETAGLELAGFELASFELAGLGTADPGPADCAPADCVPAGRPASLVAGPEERAPHLPEAEAEQILNHRLRRTCVSLVGITLLAVLNAATPIGSPLGASPRAPEPGAGVRPGIAPGDRATLPARSGLADHLGIDFGSYPMTDAGGEPTP